MPTQAQADEALNLLEALDREGREADAYAAHLRGRIRQMTEDLNELGRMVEELDGHVVRMRKQTDSVRAVVSKVVKSAILSSNTS